MIKELQHLGLTEKEARVYTLLACTEALTASTIAKRTDIQRASIYEVLAGLEKKQLVNSYKKHGYAYFYIDTPEKLILQHQAKLQIAESIVADIRQKKKKQEVSLEVYKDAPGFRQLYAQILTSGEREFLAWSNFESFDRIISPEEDTKLTTQRVANGTRPRLVMTRNSVSEKFQKEDAKWPRTTKLIDSKDNFSSTLVVSGDTVYLFDDQPDILAIRLQHPGFSTMMREIFDTYWGSLQ